MTLSVPVPSYDYVVEFPAAMRLSEPDRTAVVVFLLHAYRVDLLAQERWAKEQVWGVLQAFAEEGNHAGFLRTLCWIAFDRTPEKWWTRAKRWWWSGQILRGTLGRRRGWLVFLGLEP